MRESVTRVVTFDKWALDTPDAMWACFKDLVAAGFRGQVRAHPDVNGVLVWDMQVSSADGHDSITGAVGVSVVAKTGERVESMTETELTDRYGTTTPTSDGR